jgi:hypothetical protein
MKDPAYKNTTTDFKAGMAGSVASYLEKAANEIGGAKGTGDFTELNEKVTEINKQSAVTGYTFSIVQSKVAGLVNPEINEYKVYATSIQQSPKNK